MALQPGEHLGGQALEKRIDTGVVLVTGENMEEEAIQRLIYPPIKEYLGEAAQ